jgi:hypothetical protein
LILRDAKTAASPGCALHDHGQTKVEIWVLRDKTALSVGTIWFGCISGNPREGAEELAN